MQGLTGHQERQAVTFLIILCGHIDFGSVETTHTHIKPPYQIRFPHAVNQCLRAMKQNETQPQSDIRYLSRNLIKDGIQGLGFIL